VKEFISLFSVRTELRPHVRRLEFLHGPYEHAALTQLARELVQHLPALTEFCLSDGLCTALVEALHGKPLQCLDVPFMLDRPWSPLLSIHGLAKLRYLRLYYGGCTSRRIVRIGPGQVVLKEMLELEPPRHDLPQHIDDVPAWELPSLEWLYLELPFYALLRGTLPALRHVILVGDLSCLFVAGNLPHLFTSGQLDTLVFNTNAKGLFTDGDELPALATALPLFRARLVELDFIPGGLTVLDLHPDITTLILSSDEPAMHSRDLAPFIPTLLRQNRGKAWGGRRRTQRLKICMPGHFLQHVMDHYLRSRKPCNPTFACRELNVDLAELEGKPPSRWKPSAVVFRG
jgi:hypothetical protein